MMNHQAYRKELFAGEEDPCLEPPEEEAPALCTLCGGPVFLLGTLGNLQHFQCRHCGMESSREVGK